MQVKKISIKKCEFKETLLILSPKNCKEQRLIVEEFDYLNKKTQKLESIYQQKLSALTELKQSILQKAFSGDLTTDTIQ